MHTTTKDVIGTDTDAKAMNVPVGTHILTSVIEGDGPVAMCTDKASLSAKVLHVTRTDSGGIEVQTAVFVSEPAPATAPTPVIAEDPKFLEAVAYFVGKGLSDTEARKSVNEYGVARVLAAKDRELDNQLTALVNKSETPEA